VPLKGDYAWALMDNFEWTYGDSQPFGLVHVDFRTQRRLPKSSADWYREVIKANAVPV
jgi:beta-glucosidase